MIVEKNLCFFTTYLNGDLKQLFKIRTILLLHLAANTILLIASNILWQAQTKNIRIVPRSSFFLAIFCLELKLFSMNGNAVVRCWEKIA